MECDVCKKSRESEIFCCDGCKKPICKACGQLTTSEVRVLQLKERVLKFFCKKCRQYETYNLLGNLLETKNDLLTSKDEIIEMLKGEIKALTEKLHHQKTPEITYADMLKQNSNQRQVVNFPSLIIRPKNKQNCERSKKDVVSTINPAQLNIGIQKLIETKTGNLIIKCDTKQDIQKLKLAAEQELSARYEIEETKLRNPRIKIKNFARYLSAEDVEVSMRKQNNFFEDEDMLKVTYIKKWKNGTSDLFMECSPNLFHKIMRERKLYIDWERYYVYEDLSVLQCFKCYGFHHKNSKCTKNVICPTCGGAHKKSECENQIKKCINCISSNNKFKTKHDVDHTADDRKNCPTYQFHINNLKSKINYGY